MKNLEKEAVRIIDEMKSNLERFGVNLSGMPQKNTYATGYINLNSLYNKKYTINDCVSHNEDEPLSPWALEALTIKQVFSGKGEVSFDNNNGEVEFF